MYQNLWWGLNSNTQLMYTPLNNHHHWSQYICCDSKTNVSKFYSYLVSLSNFLESSDRQSVEPYHEFELTCRLLCFNIVGDIWNNGSRPRTGHRAFYHIGPGFQNDPDLEIPFFCYPGSGNLSVFSKQHWIGSPWSRYTVFKITKSGLPVL